MSYDIASVLHHVQPPLSVCLQNLLRNGWSFSPSLIAILLSWWYSTVPRRPLLTVRPHCEELRRLHCSVQVWRRRSGSSGHGGKGQTSGVWACHGAHQGEHCSGWLAGVHPCVVVVDLVICLTHWQVLNSWDDYFVWVPVIIDYYSVLALLI